MYTVYHNKVKGRCKIHKNNCNQISQQGCVKHPAQHPKIQFDSLVLAENYVRINNNNKLKKDNYCLKCF